MVHIDSINKSVMSFFMQSSKIFWYILINAAINTKYLATIPQEFSSSLISLQTNSVDYSFVDMNPLYNFKANSALLHLNLEKAKKIKWCKLEWIKRAILTMKAASDSSRFPAQALPPFTGSWKVRCEEGAQVLVEDESKCFGWIKRQSSTEQWCFNPDYSQTLIL